MKFADKGSRLSWPFIILPILPANTDQTPSTALCAAASTLCKGVEGSLKRNSQSYGRWKGKRGVIHHPIKTKSRAHGILWSETVIGPGKAGEAFGRNWYFGFERISRSFSLEKVEKRIQAAKTTKHWFREQEEMHYGWSSGWFRGSVGKDTKMVIWDQIRKR